jgi:hypothetical protein
VTALNDVLHYFSEVAPCGVIGSFILDKEEADTDAFTFKHHYITSAIDSGVLAALFTAMREKRAVTLSNLSRRRDLPRRNRVIPLRIFISVQTGRQHLVAYYPEYNIFQSYRVDYLSNIKLEEVSPRFDELRAALDSMQSKMWGVSVKRNKWGNEHLEHVEFTIKIEDGEDYIVRRLEREIEKQEAFVAEFDAKIEAASADYQELTRLLAEKEEAEMALMDLMEQWEAAQES